MKTKTKMNLNGSLAIAGGLLTGLGSGFFLLHISALLFVGSLLAGLGLGLTLSAFVAKEVVVNENTKEK